MEIQKTGRGESCGQKSNKGISNGRCLWGYAANLLEMLTPYVVPPKNLLCFYEEVTQ